MIQQFNAVHAALNEEIRDVREKVASSETNSSRSSYVYADGSVVLPVESTPFEMIGSEVLSNNDAISHARFLGASDSYVDDNAILKIPRANKRLLATYANMMAQKENTGKFYGMIVVDGDKKINPLHPVIAAMITSGELSLSDAFTIIVYPYRDTVDVDLEASKQYEKEIVHMLSAIRAHQYLPSISYRVSNDITQDIQNMIHNINMARIAFREDGDIVSAAIIPVQLATNQIVYPYYALIESIGGGEYQYKSRHLYPCLSGNIDTMTPDQGSTCVGDLNNHAFSSLYVLSNMNIRSLYFGSVFTSKSKDFIQACQSVSAEFLAASAGLSFDNDDAESDNNDKSEENVAPEEPTKDTTCEPRQA